MHVEDVLSSECFVQQKQQDVVGLASCILEETCDSPRSSLLYDGASWLERGNWWMIKCRRKREKDGICFFSATSRDGSVKQVYSVLAATLSTKGISAKGTIFMTGLFNLTGSWASLDTHCWRIVLNNSELLHDVERFLQEWKNATCLILSAAGDLNDSVRQLCLQDYFAHL